MNTFKNNSQITTLEDLFLRASLVTDGMLKRMEDPHADQESIHTLLATTVCNIKRMVKLLWGKSDDYYLEVPVAA